MAEAIPKWPKVVEPFTQREREIANDWMEHFHSILPTGFSGIEKFNHGYPIDHAPGTFLRTLEIGAGIGGHYVREKLSPEQAGNYYALEIRQNMADTLSERFPNVHVIVADCQKRMPYEDGFFDRVIADNVLEHLPDLPACLREVRRLLNPGRGVFSVVIPCEGGLAYSMGRAFTSKRLYEKRYGVPYRDFIKRDHVNTAVEVMDELKKYFTIQHRQFYPLKVPVITANLFIGLTLSSRQ